MNNYIWDVFVSVSTNAYIHISIYEKSSENKYKIKTIVGCLNFSLFLHLLNSKLLESRKY